MRAICTLPSQFSLLTLECRVEGSDVQLQKGFERQRNCPPLYRHATPLTGGLMWTNHILHLTESPIRRHVSPINV